MYSHLNKSNNNNRMSKHVSRFLIAASPFRNFLPRQRCTLDRLQWAQIRLQHSKPRSELPLPNAPKKSTVWRKIGWWTLAGLGTLAYAWYVKNEKDTGKFAEWVALCGAVHCNHYFARFRSFKISSNTIA